MLGGGGGLLGGCLPSVVLRLGAAGVGVVGDEGGAPGWWWCGGGGGDGEGVGFHTLGGSVIDRLRL